MSATPGVGCWTEVAVNRQKSFRLQSVFNPKKGSTWLIVAWSSCDENQHGILFEVSGMSVKKFTSGANMVSMFAHGDRTNSRSKCRDQQRGAMRDQRRTKLCAHALLTWALKLMSNENVTCPNDANNSNCWCHRFMETHVYIYMYIYIKCVKKVVQRRICTCLWMHEYTQGFVWNKTASTSLSFVLFHGKSTSFGEKLHISWSSPSMAHR